MIAVCQQPNYFPWIGYIEQCARADQLIFLDSVQFIKQGSQHRTKIASIKGDFQWLTIPVKSTNHRNKEFREIEIDSEQDWTTQHFQILLNLYRKRPYFKKQLEPLLSEWFTAARDYRTLLDATVQSLNLMFKVLDLNPKIAYSSKIPSDGAKTARIISLCKAVGADTYYSGMGSAQYLLNSEMQDAGIQLQWQRFKCAEYPQGRAEFKSHLSILDVLSNVEVGQVKRWLEKKNYGI